MAHVLVVDDEPDICLLVQVTLEADGHEVEVADGGAAALVAFARRPPDLVVLDVMMPGVDGWAVLAGIKADPDPTRQEIPVILLTALDGALDRARGGIEGAVRYLTKPIDIDDLSAAARDALRTPEREARRLAQREGLALVARIESGNQAQPSNATSAPLRPRLTEPQRRSEASPRRAPLRAGELVPTAPLAVTGVRGPESVRPPRHLDLDSLTDKQRLLVETVAAAPTVIEAAQQLGMSRSNVYASLRRISRRLGVRSAPELLEALRAN